MGAVFDKRVEEFLSHLKLAHGRSPLTLLSYRGDLKNYFDYTNNAEPSVLFQEYLEKKGLSARSQSRAISAVRSYFRFLEDHGYDIKFKEALKTPVVKIPLPHFVNHKEFENILQSAVVQNNSAETQRNHVVLYLLYVLACRVSEVVYLQLSDYLDSDESIIITGKGNKQRILPVIEPFLNLLREYIAISRNTLDVYQGSKALILNNRGKRPSRVDIWRWTQKWSKTAKLDKAKSPHQFRHGCATELLNHGADLRSIQELLGHASIETTKIYTKVSRQKMKKAVEQHHPLSKN